MTHRYKSDNVKILKVTLIHEYIKDLTMNIKNPRNYCVYKHTNTIDGKSYIGITKDFEYRCKQHQSIKTNNQFFASQVNIMGWDNFTHTILEDGLTKDEAHIRESFYITKYQSLYPTGYNIKGVYHYKKPTNEEIKRICEKLDQMIKK